MDETRKSLLLVEDEAIIAMLEKQLLEKQGYAVSHVANGEAAVRLVAGDGAIFDVILMDIDLGHGMDGTQAAEAILATVDIPIVFVSSHTEPEVVGKTEKITSYGYVVKNTGIVVLDASIKMALKLFREKVDRKRAQKLQLLSTAILGVLNQPLTLREATRSIIGLIKQETDIDAVGIRLKDGEDYPYFCEDGLGEDFLLAENSVVLRNDNGVVCKGPDGFPCLECTCGLVLAEKAGPPGDHVTPAGSIWTNDSLATLEELHADDPRLKPRDRCSHDGFQSVALIPIRIDHRVVGLLHLNDRRKDRFTPETIHFFEELTATFAIAAKRKQTESAPPGDLRKQFRHTWATLRGIIRDFDEVSWIKAGYGKFNPARNVWHTLQGTKFHIQTADYPRFPSGLSFDAQPLETVDSELPTQTDILHGVDHFAAATDEWLVRMEPQADNEDFPWTGQTRASIAWFLLRHVTYHTGELNSTLNVLRQGEVVDNWTKALGQS